MKKFLPLLLASLLLSGCGLSEDTRDQLEDAVGKAAGEIWDSTKSKTEYAVNELSTTIDEHGGAKSFFEEIVDAIINFFDGSSGNSENNCGNQHNNRAGQNQPRTIIKRSAEQQNYHEEVLSLTTFKTASVNIDCLRPELDTAINMVVAVYHEVFNNDNYRPVITSGNDSDKHGEQSAHYACAAVDIRIKDVENLETRKALAQAINNELGSRYTVLHEDVGKANEHLHIQLRSGTYNKSEVWQ